MLDGNETGDENNISILADAWPHFESVTARPGQEKAKPARLTGGQEWPERPESRWHSLNRAADCDGAVSSDCDSDIRSPAVGQSADRKGELVRKRHA